MKKCVNYCSPVKTGTYRTYFTLIELLVVVSIIGILASMLLPSLAKARKKAQLITCMNNQHQIVLAMQLYADDYEGWAVPHKGYRDFVGWASTSGGRDKRLLNAYLGGSPQTTTGNKWDGSVEVARCPSDKGQNLGGNDKPVTWKDSGTSYGAQMASVQHCGIGRSTSGGQTETSWDSGSKDNWAVWLKYSIIKFPEYKITLVEDVVLNNRHQTEDINRWHNNSVLDTRYPVAFVDGHVENFDFSWKAYVCPYPHNNLWGGYMKPGKLEGYWIDRFGYY